MIKISKIGGKGVVKLPDTMIAMLGVSSKVDVHFGGNFDVVVIVPHDKELSRDNKERIRILTEVKQ